MDVRSDASRYGAAEPSSISSTLLEQIRAHRPEAWQRLVDLYGPVVYRWCRQLGIGRADAADVVQEVFAAVAGGAGRFRRETPEQSFGAWLRTVTRSKVCDHFRRRRGLLDAEGGTDAQQRLLNLPAKEEEKGTGTFCAEHPEGRSGKRCLSPFPSADDSLSLSAPLLTDKGFVHRALEVVRAEFEPRTWDAFWQVAIDGQSPAETAAAMKLSLAAVYQAKSRVLRRLRRELRDSAE
jgi:RNA polymerase sigma-70 factor, ECF subfamily